MTDLTTAVVRFALYLDFMLLFGLPAFGLYALRGAESISGEVLPFRRLIGFTAIVGLALSAVALVLLAAAMSGVAPGEIDRASVEAVVMDTPMGTSWLIRIAALFAASSLALIRWRKPGPGLGFVVAAGTVALGSLAWTGHGAAGDGVPGWVQLVADIVHLMAAGVWIGALFALALLVFRSRQGMSADDAALAHRTLRDFSTVGTIAVALIVVSGVINSWMLVGPGNVGALATTAYGRLLVAKLLLFGAMLGLAWSNRFRLTPALGSALAAGDARQAIRMLRRSLLLEIACAVVILALVGWLGLLAPPVAA